MASDTRVFVPGGRVGRLVPADDAGEYRVVIEHDDDLAALLRPLRATEDQLIVASALQQTYCAAYGIGRHGSDIEDSYGGSCCLDDIIDEDAYRKWRGALKAVAPHKMIIARLVVDGICRVSDRVAILSSLDKLEKYFFGLQYDFS